jgi:hypothetical protein
LSDLFPIQNDLKQEDDLSPLFFHFDLEYIIRNVQENKEEVKFNEAHQLLVYADDVNLYQYCIVAYEQSSWPCIAVAYH